MTKAIARRVRVERGVYRNRSGLLEIGWRDANQKMRWRTLSDGTGVKAARAELAQETVKRAKGDAPTADPRLTFNAAAWAWWQARVVRMRPATQSAYGASLRHLSARFGNRRLASIGPDDVAAFIASSKQKGWTVRGNINVLSAVHKYAARHLGLTTVNPVTVLDKIERPDLGDAKPARVLTPSELAGLLAAIPERHRLTFRVAAETGARLGEVLGLTWADIDVREQAVTFACQLDRHGKRVPLKTARSRRSLEITPGLASELRRHKVASLDTAPGSLVFVRSTGRGHDHRNVAGRVLGAAVKRAGLASPAPSFHSLRHSHASALIAQGWDVESVSARLGHASTDTTLRIYAHEFDRANRSQERRARLTALYGADASQMLPTADGESSRRAS